MESLSQLDQLKLGRWVFAAKWFANSWLTVGLATLCVHAIAVFGQAQPLPTSQNQQLQPGAIGHRQLLHSDPLREYYSQPVQINAPDGAVIATFGNGETGGAYGQLNVALQVGNVYRFRVSEITSLGITELYPSIEVIDRLYPPNGREREFPIPVELAADDLKLAANGKYVTRVIYIEDPDDTFPYNESDLGEDKPTSDRNADQRYFEVPPGEDPYIVARGLGRPVAILRIGNRAPTSASDSDFAEDTHAESLPPPQRMTRYPMQRTAVGSGIQLSSRTTPSMPYASNPLQGKPKPTRKSFVERVSGILPIRK